MLLPDVTRTVECAMPCITYDDIKAILYDEPEKKSLNIGDKSLSFALSYLFSTCRIA